MYKVQLDVKALANVVSKERVGGDWCGWKAL
jgi:hypothetical protein